MAIDSSGRVTNTAVNNQGWQLRNKATGEVTSAGGYVSNGQIDPNIRSQIESRGFEFLAPTGGIAPPVAISPGGGAGATGGSTGINGTGATGAGSSGSGENGVNNQFKTISDAAQTDYNNYVSSLDSLKAAMDRQKQATIDSIKASYARRIAQQQQLNKSILGNVNTAELVSGRARYAPVLSSGAISSEESAGLSRIQGLENEMESLISQAESAAQEKDFKLLNDRMAAISKLRDTQRQALIDQNSMSMAKEREAREAARFNKDNTMDILKNAAESGTALDDAMLKAADTALGATGAALSYLEAQKRAKTLKTEEDKIDLMTKIVNLQTKLPAGQKFEIGGSTYEAVGNDDDKLIFHETDKATGRTVVVEYDKNSRKVTVTPTGVKSSLGGASGGGYTAQELRRLREAGIDPRDIEKADDYLYHKTGKTPVPELNEEFFSKFPLDKKLALLGKERDDYAHWFVSEKDEEKEIDDDFNKAMLETVQFYKNAGISDAEIRDKILAKLK